MLGSDRFREFLEEVEKSFDVVLLDSPPLLSVADARELIPCVDAEPGSGHREARRVSAGKPRLR